MADDQAIKILEGLWAESGDRTDPDDSALTPPLDREDGWPDSFSMSGGDVPRRRVFNQIIRELQGAASDSMRYGGPYPYDNRVDYYLDGHCTIGLIEYRATAENGPATTVVSPADVGQTTWVVVTGEITNPATPDKPTATATIPGELFWSWNCPLDGGREISAFLFEWRVSGGTFSSPISLTSTFYNLTGLTIGTTYEARVTARTSQGDSSVSAVGSAIPVAQVPGGGNTFALQATTADAEVELAWLAPESNGASITQYTYQWRTMSQMFASGRQGTTASTSATVTGLTNGTEYFFRVFATNSAGDGPVSNEASATPAVPIPDMEIPEVASAPTGQAGQGEATWIATPPSDNRSEITSYQWRWRITGGTYATVTTNLPQLIRTGLTNGSTYEAQVRATNGVGQQTTYSSSGTVTPAAEMPDQIARVVLENRTSNLIARWGAPENNGASISTYNVQIDDNSGFSSPTSSNTSNVFQTFTGLTEGTTYYVRVRAVNSAGNGAYSPTVSLSRDDLIAVPDAPGAPTGTADRLAINWEWNTPDNNGREITGYSVQWREDGNSWSGNIVNTTGSCYLLESLTGGTAYETRARATNSVGTGAWSGSSSAVTALAAVSQQHTFTTSQDWTWPYADVDKSVVTARVGARFQPRADSFDIALGTGNWQGSVSDGTTVWFINITTRMAIAYTAATRTRNSAFDIALGTGSWGGSVSDGTTVWFVDNTADMAVAYTAATRTRNSAFDIALVSSGNWMGAGSDGTTVWFVDNTADMAVAYTAATRARNSAFDIALGTGNWQGAGSDGTTVWFVDDTTDMAVAYTAATRARNSAFDIALGTGNWRGSVSDGTTVWFVETAVDIARAYQALGISSVSVLGNTYTTVGDSDGFVSATLTSLTTSSVFGIETRGNGTVAIYPQPT